jgi:serine/threonine protein phosphatase PrpC
LLLCGARENGEYVFGHIGDGCGFLYDGTDSRLISQPENGSNPGETFFVTGQDALSHLRMTTGTLRPGEAIALCSDGASASLYNYTTMQPAPAVARLCQWLVENPPELVSQALKENLDEVLRGHSHDDMSVALLLCCQQENAADSQQEEPDPWDPEDTDEWEEIPDEGDSYV